ncbi:MAG: tRNA (N6-isopentenyl adenosine(37)-C2)-methylthiotransferase MiaB [Bacteroidota bacterium]
MIARNVYIETYGCQMNVADSEIVLSVLSEKEFIITDNPQIADLILINTCSVRENAEQRVRGRLQVFNQIKKKRPGLLIGVIGCMAERLKEQLLEEEKMVDIVIGPDAYRELPILVQIAESGHKAVNVLLSHEETYADINPVRLGTNKISAFISIMRGCENMCTYCIVPYTRGSERSRNPETIINEATMLFYDDYREIILIGQNVDSYKWVKENGDILSFADLLIMVAEIHPDLRIRFATSHPKDLTDDVLLAMKNHENICKSIHLPVQSGSDNMLNKMNRGYSKEWYLSRIDAINRIIPDCSLSTDIMVGFCDETEDDHSDTLKLMKSVIFDFAYMFKYSERPKTYAARKFEDNIPEEIKVKRLNEVIELQNRLSKKSKLSDIGKTYRVLVEGVSKKNSNELFGRNSQNKVIVFPAENYKTGDYVNVEIKKCTSATLIGKCVG